MELIIFLVQWILFFVLCIRKIRKINLDANHPLRTSDSYERRVVIFLSLTPLFNIVFLGFLFSEDDEFKKFLREQ